MFVGVWVVVGNSRSGRKEVFGSVLGLSSLPSSQTTGVKSTYLI